MPVTTYDDEHRIFLQGLMCRGILSAKEVNKLLASALTNCDIALPDNKKERQEVLLHMIESISNKLRPLSLTVRKGVDEDDGTNYFMLVNLTRRSAGQTDDLARVQSQFKPVELEYLRLIATEILHSPNARISANTALNLIGNIDPSLGRGFNMGIAERSIDKLSTNFWLKMLGGHLTLGVRFIGEMEKWIIETMDGEVKKCKICNKLAIRHVACKCGLVFHRNCGNRMRQAQSVEVFQCTGCQSRVKLDESKQASSQGAQRNPDSE